MTTHLSDLRLLIQQNNRTDEHTCIQNLLDTLNFSESTLHDIEKRAAHLVESVRKKGARGSNFDAFLQQYSLSSGEGLRMMGLAEAMLRTQDTPTINDLIQDKLGAINWSDTHTPKSARMRMMNLSLMWAGKILNFDYTKRRYLANLGKRILKHSGTPIVRTALFRAMHLFSTHFVMGQTIEKAIKRASHKSMKPYRISYDMLGEAACTYLDAEKYFESYQHAILKISKHTQKTACYENPGISVKLSALHPRYEFSQRSACIPALTERLKKLALQARAANMGLTVDAEEADRLELSLEIIAQVFSDPALDGWHGFGVALQAYQKRAYYVIDWLAHQARTHKRPIMLRLIKGAYWDTEIKDSQIKGLAHYPVFTRKANTDVAYLACAKKIIAYGALFFPQFATHNAHTISAVLTLLGARKDFEFQRLKGMGKTLYDEVQSPPNAAPCRIYAPVGPHKDLLPYLVRRLLENGANQSFVNQIADANISTADLIADPIQKLIAFKQKSHPQIPLPPDLFKTRRNSLGTDLSDPLVVHPFIKAVAAASSKTWQALPTFETEINTKNTQAVPSAYEKTRLGTCTFATEADVVPAIERAHAAWHDWSHAPLRQRTACLEGIADRIEANKIDLTALLIQEAGKCIPDALNEIREAVDFCRYYAKLAQTTLGPLDLPGPTGEHNRLEMHGRGVFVCISPWNFPLAIFTGQIVAALVSGNCVIAKPAEQTPLIAAQAITYMHEAGVPKAVLQLMPGSGAALGPALTSDSRIAGVMFTGSTQTARAINQTLAQRTGAIVPFVAETGGQNALIADSTALPEQLVKDVLFSAFNSAGQRCSALRVLFLQTEMADKVIALLKAAMQTLQVGDPGKLCTDVGPVIDAKAKAMLEKHAQYLSQKGTCVAKAPMGDMPPGSTFFAPSAYEIPHLELLSGEIFGPILHIIRYKRTEIDKVIQSINDTQYGLTFGIHTRIAKRAAYALSHIKTGNCYINRNIVGAIVGVQPFGGQGLSGTGPKAGGPHYLLRLCHEHCISDNTAASGVNAHLMSLQE